jgi:hypothetical protein
MSAMLKLLVMISLIVSARQALGITVTNLPVFSPVAGTYASTQTVTITVSSPVGATICYRTDGANPTAATAGTCDAGSTTYSSALTVSATQTIRAISSKAGYTNSSVVTAAYTITSGSTRKRVRVEQ